MRNYLIIISAIMVLWVAAATNARYSGGTGEPNDPYRIATPEDLNDIGNYEEDWDKHFILVNDVNLAQYTGTQFNIISTVWNNAFTGVFDGNDHKIWNFTWTSDDQNNVGLFGWVGIGGQIKNLGMENVDVNAVNGHSVGGLVGINGGEITNCYSKGKVSGTPYYLGGLVGWNFRGTITNCYSNGSVRGEGAGGLVGYNYMGTINNCYSTVSVSGGLFVGGLVGTHQDGLITNCYSICSVLGISNVGGLVGFNYIGTIENCYSSTAISGDGEVGGLVGGNLGMVNNCYSTGSVSARGSVGGLVGENEEGTVTNCYSTGEVSGGRDSVGGLIGVNFDTITNCYSAGNVTGSRWVGGLVGTNSGAINACYSTGNVDGNDCVGGLVGWNEVGTIRNCYSSGSITGVSCVGGIIGKNGGGCQPLCPGWIYNCYSVGRVTGSSNVGGLVGVHIVGEVGDSFWDKQASGQSTSGGGTPKSTVEMQTKNTFRDACWDFVEIWGIGEHQTYPFLQTEPAGDSNHDKKVDLTDLAILASHWLDGTPP
jgi:hypothetical protein